MKGEKEEKKKYAESLFQLSNRDTKTQIRLIILPIMTPDYTNGGGHYFSLPTVVQSAGDDVMVYPFEYDSAGSVRENIGSKNGLKTICSTLKTIVGGDMDFKKSDITQLNVERQQGPTECGPLALSFVEKCVELLSSLKDRENVVVPKTMLDQIFVTVGDMVNNKCDAYHRKKTKDLVMAHAPEFILNLPVESDVVGQICDHTPSASFWFRKGNYYATEAKQLMQLIVTPDGETLNEDSFQQDNKSLQ